MYRSRSPNTGSNPREGRILKKNCFLDNFPSSTCWKIGVKSFLKRYHQQSFKSCLVGEWQQQVIMHLFYLFSAILSFLALYFLSFNILSLQLFGYPLSILYGGEDFFPFLMLVFLRRTSFSWTPSMSYISSSFYTLHLQVFPLCGCWLGSLVSC